MKVPLPGLPTRLAALVVLGATTVVVGIALLGQGGDRTSGSPAALEGPTVRPTPILTPYPTPEPTPAWTPSSLERALSAPTGGTPLPDVAGALPGDDGNGPLPLGMISEVPNADRLDFLFELCWPECYRDAHWLDPQNPDLGSGV